IMVERSIEMMVGLFAILKSGGAYLPIDPYYPGERKQYMLTDSNAKLVLTQKSFAHNIENRYEIIDLEDFHEPEHEPAVCDPWLRSGPANLAYVIYTSGSTGKPKGVMIEHKPLVNRLNWMQKFYPLGEEDVILQKTTIVFDVSVWELFWWSIRGASVCLLAPQEEKSPEAILEAINKSRVTTMHFVPSMLNAFLVYLEGGGDIDRLASLRRVFSSGEALMAHHAERFYKLLLVNEKNDVKLVNLYGPTEATIDVSYFNCAKDEHRDDIPIGKPIDNIRLYIINKEMGLQLVRIAGELCIAGDGLARGYLGKPELTAEKFIDSPFVEGERLYRTGDLVRWLPDGNIEFLGRIDHQVKIRGYRIELEEIENQLLKHDDIKEAVVLANEDESGDKYLCAYIVRISAVSDVLSVSELKEYLTGKLPSYMIPPYFIHLKAIPLTPSGKIDRKALPSHRVKLGLERIGPENEIERSLVEIWSEVLGIEKDTIGIDDNFFELGGHSLKATLVIARLQKKLNVKLTLADLFKKPVIRGLGQIIKKKTKDKYASIEPVEEKEYYELSSAQERLYILHQMDVNSIAYNMPEVIPLGHEPDIKILEETFIKLINRHESLRTSFHMINEEAVQRIHKEVKFKIKYHKVEVEEEEGLEPAARSPQPAAALISSFIRPFDLSRAPILKVGLLKTPDEQHCFLIDMHHIISDGVSQRILVTDFMALYEGEELAPLRIQYKDFSQWQNSEKENGNLEQQKDYWLKEFAGEIPVLNLPVDYVRPVVQGFSGNSLLFELAVKEREAIKSMAMTHGSTLFMALLSVFYVFLFKLCGQEDLIVGIPTAGRRHADLEKIIGMFVNTLALRNYPGGDKTFEEFLEEVKERTLKAFENQDHQFEDLVEQVTVKRDASRNPLFDVMFSLEEVEGNIQSQNTDFYLHENVSSKFDMTLTALNSPENLGFRLTYNTTLFNNLTIERYSGYLKKIISVVTSRNHIKMSRIELLSEEEKRHLLYDFNETRADFPKDKTIHQLFEEQVERTPQQVALMGPETGLAPLSDSISITYKELNNNSNQLAQRLKAKGIHSDMVVAILTKPSTVMILAIMAVLQAGGCYLPIDPANPRERIAYMLKDSETKLLLTREGTADESLFAGEILDIRHENVVTYKSKGLAKKENHKPGNSVYMIYTSGTTGKPKGVLLTHKNLVNYVTWFSGKTRLTAEDKTVLTSSFVFDLGYTSLYPSLLRGAQLHILPKETYMLPERLLDYICLQGITYLKMTPSLFSTIVADWHFSEETCRMLRLVVLGGEAINTADVEKALGKCSHLKIMNHYGPTEVTIGCIAQFIDPGDINAYKTRPTIGNPIGNTKVFILDKYLCLLPVGIAGELCLSGAGLARGYLNQPELIAEKFNHDLWDLQDYHDEKKEVSIPKYNKKFLQGVQGGSFYKKRPPGRRRHKIYKTGDRARWLPNGYIEFLGRIDQQVKIRGYRVELGEIENCLQENEQIKEAVVTAETNDAGNQYLCAYIVPYSYEAIDDDGSWAKELKTYLSLTLPDYMVPTYFIPLEQLPLTPNGKLDRKALPRPGISITKDYLDPRDPMEEKLVEIWQEMLGVEGGKLSINTNFFELGGNSLNAVIMISKVHKEFNVRIPLAEIFKMPTIMGLSAFIKGAAQDRYVSIEPLEKKEYYELSSAQQRLFI
ncbi:MAG: amino acid adenylation domain-containing protein, partial [Candidatus Aminicenantes bacterium]